MKWNKAGEGFGFGMEQIMTIVLVIIGILVGLGIVYLGGTWLELW